MGLLKWAVLGALGLSVLNSVVRLVLKGIRYYIAMVATILAPIHNMVPIALVLVFLAWFYTAWSSLRH